MSAPRRHWESKTHPREDPSLFLWRNKNKEKKRKGKED
jgi:hypothetical protein